MVGTKTKLHDDESHFEQAVRRGPELVHLARCGDGRAACIVHKYTFVGGKIQ